MEGRAIFLVRTMKGRAVCLFKEWSAGQSACQKNDRQDSALLLKESRAGQSACKKNEMQGTLPCQNKKIKAKIDIDIDVDIYNNIDNNYGKWQPGFAKGCKTQHFTLLRHTRQARIGTLPCASALYLVKRLQDKALNPVKDCKTRHFTCTLPCEMAARQGTLPCCLVKRLQDKALFPVKRLQDKALYMYSTL
jgi:hypothetical protein